MQYFINPNIRKQYYVLWRSFKTDPATSSIFCVVNFMNLAALTFFVFISKIFVETESQSQQFTFFYKNVEKITKMLTSSFLKHLNNRFYQTAPRTPLSQEN